MPKMPKSKAELVGEVKILLTDVYGKGADRKIDFLLTYFTSWDLEGIRDELIGVHKKGIRNRK